MKWDTGCEDEWQGHPRILMFQCGASVQSLSRVWSFATPWKAFQAPLSFTISLSLLRFMSIELVKLSNHLVLCCTLFEGRRAFSLSQHQGFFQWVSSLHQLAKLLELQHQLVSSVTQSCSTLCNPMDCNMPGSSVLHYLPEFAQIHVYCFIDSISPSHSLPLLSTMLGGMRGKQ